MIQLTPSPAGGGVIGSHVTPPSRVRSSPATSARNVCTYAVRGSSRETTMRWSFAPSGRWKRDQVAPMSPDDHSESVPTR